MNNNDFPTLALKRFNSGFIDSTTEAEYRNWCIEDRLPAIRMGGFIALFGWFTFNLYPYLYYSEVAGITLFPIYGVMVPSLVIGLALSWIQPWRRYLLMPGACALLSLSGFIATWWGYTLAGEIGGAPLGLMMAVLYAPFMRITGGWSVTALLPPLGYCIYLIAKHAESQSAFGAAEWFYSTFPIMGFITVVVVNLMHDRRTHCTYRDQRIIALQKAQLELAQSQIRRYIPPAVADQIISGNEAAISEPKRQRVTVLFADIVGFTDIADRVEPEVMTEVLNDYMSAMADLIEQHGGTLNEFAGDGLMALFGAPDTMTPEEQARNAIQAAQAMQSKMPELNEQWRKLGLGAELQTRIGINTGMVSVGSYGSQGRMTYTAIGLQTNIASRIESAAEPGQTLISDASYQLISDEINCEPKGEVECKGVHFPVKVYSPAKA